jgi:hypothetical protein
MKSRNDFRQGAVPIPVLQTENFHLNVFLIDLSRKKIMSEGL